MWLISHASGTIGRAAFRAAVARGHRVRVLIRDTAQAALFAPAAESRSEAPAEARAEARTEARTEVIVADLADTAEHQRAFEGVEAAILTAPLGSEFVPWHRALAEAAETARVRHVVQLSGQGADLNSPTRILRWLGDAEAQAANAGIHATVLRPSLYMQMLFKHVPEMCSCGVIEAPFRNARWGMVDARDVAEVAVERLERGAKPRVHELTGPQALDYAEIAKIISKVTGRKITYVDVCSPKARGRLEAKRVSPRLTEALLEYWDFHAASATTPRLSNEIEAILGRPPRKLAEFVKDHRAEFGGGSCLGFSSLWGRK